SHGEQRTLEIAVAMATDPQLLCLDEPTAGMSAAETRETVALVRRIAEHLTILIVEHDMEVVMGLANSITVLHYGRVLAEGTIAGIVHPSAGRVLFEGRSITNLPAHRLARLGIGYVPEDRRIFPLLTVTENLRTGLDRHGVTTARKKELLDKSYGYFPVLAERR